MENMSSKQEMENKVVEDVVVEVDANGDCYYGLPVDVETLENDDDYILYEDQWYTEEAYAQLMQYMEYYECAVYAYHDYPFQYKPFYSELELGSELSFGFEIETTGDIYNAYIVKEDYSKWFHCEKDGSIEGAGFEIISQPMSLQYMKENIGTFCRMLSELQDAGQEADDETCGLHIHVNKDGFDDQDAIDRAKAIVSGFQDNIEILARRKGNMYCEYAEVEDKKNIVKKSFKEKTANADRYCAVNDKPEKTVEFRVFQSTLDIETLYASIELVNNIVEMANSGENDICFDELLYGDFLREYAKEMGVDTTATISLKEW